MRVDLLTPTLGPEDGRGSELVRELAVSLRALGHAPRILAGHAGPPQRSIEDGVAVLRVPRIADRLARARGFSPHSTHVPFSWAALHAGDAAIAHAFSPADAEATVRWARRTGRPCVFTLIEAPTRATVASFRRRLRGLEQATRESDAVLVLDEESKRATRRWLGVDAEVISPGIAVDTGAPGARKEGVDPQRTAEAHVAVYTRLLAR